MGTLDTTRFKKINQTLFGIAKKYTPKRKTLKRKDFLELFYSWIPEFKDAYGKLSEKSKVKYAGYVFDNGKFVEFKVCYTSYEISKEHVDRLRVKCYIPVFDQEQRADAENQLEWLFQSFFSEGNNAKEEMVNEAIKVLEELSKPDPALKDGENEKASSERENCKRAYNYFKSRKENNISNTNILAEILWYSLSGRYNYSYMDHHSPNVYIASKGEIEQDEAFNLDERCKDANYLLVIAFAATTFLAGRLVSKSCYGPKWRRFFNELAESKAKIDIVTLAAGSPAEEDAVKYKMRPLTINSSMDLDNIVASNQKSLRDSILQNGLKNVQLYETDIALPVSYVVAEFEDSSRDNIKVDLYLPIINDYNEDTGEEERRLIDESRCDTTVRHSFVIFRNDKSTEKLYYALRRNAEDILKHSIQIL